MQAEKVKHLVYETAVFVAIGIINDPDGVVGSFETLKGT